METHRKKCCQRDARRQGSVYVLVLGASLIVATIGVSVLMAARVQRRAVVLTADMTQARFCSQSGIDLVLYKAATPSGGLWRVSLGNGDLVGVSLGEGTFTITAVDPVDGDLMNNLTDPVILTSTGSVGETTYILEVTLNGDGIVQPGTWKRVVN